MIVCNHHGISNVPASVFDPQAPIKYLECSICACLVSHLKDDYKVDELPEILVRVSNNTVKIATPNDWCVRVFEVAQKCYILKSLKLSWIIEISDINLLNSPKELV